MFRLRNAESGRVEAVPATAGQGLVLRVPAPPPGAGAVIGLLVADLIRRVLGRHRVRVLASYAAEPPGALNLYPPDEVASSASLAPGLHVAWDDGDLEAAPGRRFVVRPALPDLTAARSDGLAAPARDPLAVRLALLGRHYADPAPLAEGAVAAAEEELRRWRDAVARWADSPSRPMCAEYVARFADACDADLDTVAALGALRDLETDSELPDGAKFETFVHADAVLALDLMRDIGRT